MTEDNHLLGKFELLNLPELPQGVPKVDVTFDVDGSGILQVSAVETNSGVINNITINNDKVFLFCCKILFFIVFCKIKEKICKTKSNPLKAVLCEVLFLF